MLGGFRLFIVKNKLFCLFARKMELCVGKWEMWAICACLIVFSMESVRDIFVDVIKGYPDLTVHLTLFNVTIAEGEP